MIYASEFVELVRKDFRTAVARLEVTDKSTYKAILEYVEVLANDHMQGLASADMETEKLRELRGKCQILNELLAEFANAATLLQESMTHNQEDKPSDYDGLYHD